MSSAPTPFSRAVERLVAAIVARPWISLFLLLAASGAAGAWGSGLPIRTDMEDLFPESSENVIRAREAREILGTKSELQVLVGGPTREENLEAATAIAAALEGYSELIDTVELRREVSAFRDNALLYLPLEDLKEMHEEVLAVIQDAVAKEMALDDDFGLDDDEEEEAGSVNDEEEDKSSLPTEAEIRERYGGGDLSEYFESPDGQVLAVKAYPTFKPADTERSAELMGRLEADIARVLEAHPGLEVVVEGDYSQLSRALDQIRADLSKATGLSLGLIFLILVVWFRRLRAIAVVLLPLLCGIAWTLAFARLAIGYLNVITAFIFAILLGLGIDFAVHAASRGDEELRAGHPLPRALPRALSRLGRAMLAAALTTMSTFAALMAFEFRGFSQFGAIAAAGVLLCLLAVYVVLPSLSVSLDRLWAIRRPEGVEPPEDGAAPLLLPPSPSQRRGAWALVLVFALALAGAATQLPSLAFETDMGVLRAKTTRKSSDLKKKYRKEAETRTASPALVITATAEEAKAVHQAYEALITEDSLLTDVASIWTFVPDEQQAKLPIVREMKRRVDQKYGLLEGQDKEDADRLREFLEPAPMGVDDLPAWVKEKFTDTEGNLGRYVLLYARGRKADARVVLAIQEEIGSLELDGTVHKATAPYFITGDAFDTLRKEGPLAVGVALLVTILLVIGDMRRLRTASLALVPLLSGFVIFLGALVVFEITLNLFNVVVLPTIVGIGVDTSIHLVHRIEEERGNLALAVRTTGGAAAISSATTAAGFLGLTVVTNEGLTTIGWTAVIGIAVVFSSCVGLTWALATLWPARPTDLHDPPGAPSA